MQTSDVTEAVEPQQRPRWPVDLSRMTPIEAGNLVATRFGDGALPVCPNLIAQRLGVSLFYLTGDDACPIHVGPEGSLRLAIPREANDLRRRFIVARGLGHLVLRHPWPSLKQWLDFGDDPPSRFDQDASHFAITLLVPSEDLLWSVTSGWARNVDQICAWFQIPEDLLSLRYLQVREGF